MTSTMKLGTSSDPLPVYTEDELDNQLKLRGYRLSSGFYSQASPINQLTTQNADHFLLEAEVETVSPVVLRSIVHIPLLGDITSTPDINSPLSIPLFSFYKNRLTNPARVQYSIITRKGLVVYNLPLTPSSESSHKRDSAGRFIKKEGVL